MEGVDLIVLHRISCFKKQKKTEIPLKVQIDLDRGTKLPTSTGGPDFFDKHVGFSRPGPGLHAGTKDVREP